MRPLPRGSIIGMLGGGQLGRMAALAAAPLGYQVHVYDPSPGSPTAQVTSLETVAAWDDQEALARFAGAVDVVTLEFENVPAAAVDFLGQRVPVHPGRRALEICQDRVREKSFAASCGAATTAWLEVHGPDDLAEAAAELGTPCVLKRTRFGYDGHGQVRIQGDTDPRAAWDEMAGQVGIVEAFVDYACEVSAVIARGASGDTALFPIVENRHTEDHVLATTLAPAPDLSPELAAQAGQIARAFAEQLDYVGVLAVEFFVTSTGELLVNEMAPRPHNSGHWTLDGCMTSQFAQQIRAVAGLALGSPRQLHAATMTNLLGDQIQRRDDWIADPACRVHLYGKRDVRPGRKMGHVTRLGDPIA